MIKNNVIMQGKLIAVAYTLCTYQNQFSLGGICKQLNRCIIGLFSIRGGKALNFKKLG